MDRFSTFADEIYKVLNVCGVFSAVRRQGMDQNKLTVFFSFFFLSISCYSVLVNLVLIAKLEVQASNEVLFFYPALYTNLWWK